MKEEELSYICRMAFRERYHNVFHKEQRQRKNNREQQRCSTPPYLFKKSYIEHMHSNLMKKYGYRQNYNDNKILNNLRDSFSNRLYKYINKFGNGVLVKKKGRLDKIKIKQQSGFQMKRNPLFIFVNLEGIQRYTGLLMGFNQLKTHHLKKNVKKHSCQQKASDSQQ